jgi:hypothetical protein
MVRPGRDRLAGRVEGDETYLGGVEEGLRGRHLGAKTLIVVAAQEDGRGIGRIPMRQIADAEASATNSRRDNSRTSVIPDSPHCFVKLCCEPYAARNRSSTDPENITAPGATTTTILS